LGAKGDNKKENAKILGHLIRWPTAVQSQPETFHWPAFPPVTSIEMHFDFDLPVLVHVMYIAIDS